MITENLHPQIGREVYDVVDRYDIQQMCLLMKARNFITDEIGRSLLFRLENNSEVAGSRIFGDQRPASAYFTLTKEGIVIIEWGEITTNGKTKLHGFLNDHIDKEKRIKEGALVRSGHIGIINIPGFQESVRVALFDTFVTGEVITPLKSEFRFVTTFLKQGFVPITAPSGQPVEIKLR